MTLGPFEGVNAGYVLELYERYRQNPESVDPATREAFKTWTPADLETLAGPAPAGPKGPALRNQPALPDQQGAATGAPTPDVRVIVGAANLVSSERRSVPM